MRVSRAIFHVDSLYAVGLRTDALKRAEIAVQISTTDFKASEVDLVPFMSGPAPQRALRCLSENERSRAFEDDFDVGFSGRAEASCTSTLQLPKGVGDDLTVSALSWNCTGNMLAAAFRDPRASEGWTSSGFLAAWNLQVIRLPHASDS